jgi:hypothetical protein
VSSRNAIYLVDGHLDRIGHLAASWALESKFANDSKIAKLFWRPSKRPEEHGEPKANQANHLFHFEKLACMPREREGRHHVGWRPSRPWRQIRGKMGEDLVARAEDGRWSLAEPGARGGTQ